MSVDLAAIRAKLSALSNVGSSRKNTSWKPEENKDAIVRLVSFPNNDGQPFKELWWYYGIGQNSGLLAPYQFGKKDPVQELIAHLREDKSKESYELCKKLYPKMRCYAAVIVRGEEDKGVRLWGFGKELYQAFLNTMLDDDYGDITDPETGRDVRVACSKAPGKDWATTTISPRVKPSHLSEDKKQAKEWLESIPKVEETFQLKTYDELSKIVNDWLNPEEATTQTEKGGSASKPDFQEPKVASKKASVTQTIDDVFADIE